MCLKQVLNLFVQSNPDRDKNSDVCLFWLFLQTTPGLSVARIPCGTRVAPGGQMPLALIKNFFFFFSFSSQLNAVERQRSTLYNAVLTGPISDNCYLQLFVYLTVFQHKQHQLTFPQNTSSTDDPPSLHCNSPVSRKEGMRTCPVLLKRFFFLTAWKNKNESGLPMRAEMK